MLQTMANYIIQELEFTASPASYFLCLKRTIITKQKNIFAIFQFIMVLIAQYSSLNHSNKHSSYQLKLTTVFHLSRQLYSAN